MVSKVAKGVIYNMDVIGSKPHVVFDMLFLKVCVLGEVTVTWQ